jgi:methionine synthase II (cobalamin-independent)
MSHELTPDRVHLVGSIGIDTVEEVFRTAGRLLGRRLKRVPDGEPGGRRLWAAWQYPLLRANPYLRADPSGAVRKNSRLPQLCLAEDVDPADVRFSELGYAREARASYLDFVSTRERGELPATARFQVCLPTPVAVIYSFCTTRNLIPILDAYEKAMIREVKAVAAGIPHSDLCIQFDICQEMILCDGQPQDEFPAVNASLDELMERVRRLAACVPPAAELGFHLCYGDFGARHFIEPVDASRLVDVANTLTRIVDRPIAYVHVPVPLTRTDDDYFRPLANLRLRPDTELYLGLIHAQDGMEGARRRIATAAKYAASFGIGTECGMARARKPEVVHALLKLHAELAREPA